MILAAAVTGLLLALLPALTFLANLSLFRRLPPAASDRDFAPISVLIPARDEEKSIDACIRHALQCEDVTVEVVVLDDESTDGTADIIRSIAREDDRVRYVAGSPLPDGWNGKQHACMRLAEEARYPRLVFLDADVRLAPDSLARLAAHQDATCTALLSAFPRQQTGTILERWIIPLMHFILLGFLPLRRMRQSVHPAYAAGCGQLFMTSATDYRKAGTHAAIKGSRHDGLKLPRAYRETGLMTDVTDGTDLALCRMYGSASEVIRGVLKNAIEGIAAPKLIFPFSILLIGGSVLPVLTLGVALSDRHVPALLVSAAGVVLGHLPRAISAFRFRQSIIGVLFHSVATLLFVLLQWVALVNHLRGRQVAWRGRSEG